MTNDSETLGLLGRPQLKDLAYERLKQAIVTLELPPGAPLRESQLATKFGISKTPIREAFVRLVQEGLVEVEPYRGATVRGYTREDLVEIFELRELIEGFAARQAAETMNEADRKELAANVRVSEACLRKSDLDALADLLSEFDRILYRQTTNGRVGGLLDQIQSHIERIGRLTVGIPGRLAHSVEQHAAIARAIQERKGDLAERRMRSHVRSVMGDELESVGATEA